MQASVTPGQVNHIKLAIADTGDAALDSAVFIQAGSISTNPGQGGGPALPPTSDPNEAFLRQVYRDTLNRNPDPAGLAFHLNNLASGQTREQVAFQFLHSEEFFRREVGIYYRRFLDRNADSAGLQFFVDQLLDGRQENEIVIQIVTSPEYAQKFGQTNESFVRQLYSDILERDADQGGLTMHLNALNAGLLNREVIAFNFLIRTRPSRARSISPRSSCSATMCEAPSSGSRRSTRSSPAASGRRRRIPPSWVPKTTSSSPSRTRARWTVPGSRPSATEKLPCSGVNSPSGAWPQVGRRRRAGVCPPCDACAALLSGTSTFSVGPASRRSKPKDRRDAGPTEGQGFNRSMFLLIRF